MEFSCGMLNSLHWHVTGMREAREKSILIQVRTRYTQENRLNNFGAQTLIFDKSVQNKLSK
jgi:hypothetical protein